MSGIGTRGLLAVIETFRTRRVEDDIHQTRLERAYAMMARVIPPLVWIWWIYVSYAVVFGFFGPQPLASGPDGFRIFGRHFSDKGDLFFVGMVCLFGCYSCFKLVSLACSIVFRKTKQCQKS